jgi:hypothetical protein
VLVASSESIWHLLQPIEDDQEAASRNASEAPGFDLQHSGSCSSDGVYPESFETKTKASKNREITLDVDAALVFGSGEGTSK